jgi:transposase
MALAAITDGKNRMQAAPVGLMDRQTLKDRVIRFNEEEPENHVPGLVRWRCIDLVAVVKERFGVECHAATISRILGEMGFSHINPRPQHPKQDDRTIEEYKKLQKPPN